MVHFLQSIDAVLINLSPLLPPGPTESIACCLPKREIVEHQMTGTEESDKECVPAQALYHPSEDGRCGIAAG